MPQIKALPPIRFALEAVCLFVESADRNVEAELQVKMKEKQRYVPNIKNECFTFRIK
jgi:hypothetical protein